MNNYKLLLYMCQFGRLLFMPPKIHQLLNTLFIIIGWIFTPQQNDHRILETRRLVKLFIEAINVIHANAMDIETIDGAASSLLENSWNLRQTSNFFDVCVWMNGGRHMMGLGAELMNQSAGKVWQYRNNRSALDGAVALQKRLEIDQGHTSAMLGRQKNANGRSVYDLQHRLPDLETARMLGINLVDRPLHERRLINDSYLDCELLSQFQNNHFIEKTQWPTQRISMNGFVFCTDKTPPRTLGTFFKKDGGIT